MGVGPQLSRMTAGALHDTKQIVGPGELKADIHVRRVLGRVFTGDRPGDWVYGALHRAGYANQGTSVSLDDGLELSGAYIGAIVRCAPPDNRPTREERAACMPYARRELDLLGSASVVVALGAYAHDAVCDLVGLRPRPKFGHMAEAELPDGRVLLDSYHPSQRNTFTGKLTQEMFDAVFARAREIANGA